MSQSPNPTIVIGSGRTANIYEWSEGQALKLFSPEADASFVEEEARIGSMIHDMGLPTPDVFDVVNVEGRIGIIYERIEGHTMAEVILAAPWKMFSQMTLFAKLHAHIHHHKAPQLPPQKERLRQAVVRAPDLSTLDKAELLHNLNQFSETDCLCHGDFHPSNVMLANQRVVAIDWENATCGPPLADVARTYLLFHVALKQKRLARLAFGHYIKVYQRYQQINFDELNIWIAIVAAARLSERIADEHDALLTIVKTLT
jgi:uncharacterized protein (TIGR02172 family)